MEKIPAQFKSQSGPALSVTKDKYYDNTTAPKVQVPPAISVTKDKFYDNTKGPHVKVQVPPSVSVTKDDYYDNTTEAQKPAATKPQGSKHADNRYVTITHNYPTYSNFAFKTNHKVGTLKGIIFHSTGKYYHQNGSTYLSLYDNNGKWVGYINQKAVTETTINGKWQSAKGYVTFSDDSVNAYHDLKNTTVLTSASALSGHTYKVTGKYVGFDGTVQYSVYTMAGKWLGYVSGAKVTQNEQGSWQPYSGFFTTTKAGKTIWNSFGFQSGNSTTKYLHTTYQIKGVYYHANGTKYYSLYASNGKWMGYINANLGTESKTAGGAWISTHQNVKIAKKNYTIWHGFFTGKSGSTSKMINQIYTVTGKYHHLNGSWYYSLYSGKTWIGYVNAKAVKALN